MKKIFVFDTNVILFDPSAIFKFEDNDCIIPFSVIEEIDKFKKDLNENGRNARQLSRYIDDLRKKGSLSSGIKLDRGTLKIEIDFEGVQNLPRELQNDKADNRILSLILKMQKKHPDEKIIFLTKDTNLRIKADLLGIVSQDYEPQKVSLEELYSGINIYEVPSDAINSFIADKKLAVSDETLMPNEYIMLRDETNPSLTAIGSYNLSDGHIYPIHTPPNGIWGIFPKNAEQSFALDMLLNDKIKLVTMVGKAGTGKTLLALAAGLVKTVDEGIYNRLLVSRPIFPLGRDIGFLPGDMEEKLNPWMQPIFDNVEFLLEGNEAKTRGKSDQPLRRSRFKESMTELMNQGMLNIEPLMYIRGRSIANQYLIVDEAQNLTPHEIKTIVTRAGNNTKIVLTGDCYQIDNPYIDSASNGLTYVIERFKREKISAHVTLTKGERSELSELATNLL